LNDSWSDLTDWLKDNAIDQLRSALLRIVPPLLAKFIPGGGIISSLFEGLTFLVDNQSALGTFFDGRTRWAISLRA
jgi:hypothetical protein